MNSNFSLTKDGINIGAYPTGFLAYTSTGIGYLEFVVAKEFATSLLPPKWEIQDSDGTTRIAALLNRHQLGDGQVVAAFTCDGIEVIANSMGFSKKDVQLHTE